MKYMLFFLSLGVLLNTHAQTYKVYDVDGNQVNSSMSPAEFEDNRINLVILAEGYAETTSDWNQFIAQKDAFLYQLFEDELRSTPFPQYRAYFKVFYVWVPDLTNTGLGCKNPCEHVCENEWGGVQQTGPNHCLTAVAAHFESRHDRNGYHRFILPEDPVEVLDLVQNTMFDGNVDAPLTIAILANALGSEDKHEGGGAHQKIDQTETGVFVVGSLSNDESYTSPVANPDLTKAGNTGVHELAHTFANLLDEYWFDMAEIVSPCTGGACNEGFNRTINGVADSDHPWWPWLSANTEFDNSGPNPPADIVSHMGWTDCDTYEQQIWYKPTDWECKMEVPGSAEPFCAVCKEQIIE
ncbi:MAG: M64 family metallopeptidase, partial [Flavobacteriales bacterium]|nr:M64 family metallopeptidase [Flavobacteriales bacterium]